MVDLARTEEQLLAEIEFKTCTAPAEARALDAPWRLAGRAPADLFPLLTKTFSACYAHVPAEHVTRDLIDLVKKGLGNAYKWGNGRDPEKLLVVTTVMTRLGAVIKISDQGNGFDVPRVVRERSFTHGGSGLTRFRKTSSIITYADGGRTLLIRFLCDAEGNRDITGTGMTNSGAPSNTRGIQFSDLRPCDQVKVKGVLEPNGTLLARKVTVKPYEELAVIEAQLQEVQHDRHAIRILDVKVALPRSIDIMDAELKPAGVDQLRAGHVVWLSGRYDPGEGLAAVRIKIRRERHGDMSELQGRIETINHVDRSFRVIGITVVTNDQTDVLRADFIEKPVHL
jgi:hypothetical protein